MSRSLWFPLAACLLLGGALLVRDAPPEERLIAAANDLHTWIQSAGTDLEARADALGAQLRTGKDPWTNLPDERRERREAGIEYVVFGNEGIRYWTGTAPVPLSPNERAALITAPDGIWLHAMFSEGATRVHALRRIWYQPPFENHYLHRGFHASIAVPPGIEAATTAGLGPVVRTPNGVVAFRLQWRDDVPAPGRSGPWRLLAFFSALALLVVSLFHAFLLRAQRGKPSSALIGFVALVVLLRALGLWLGPWPLLSAEPLFGPSLFFASSFWLPSLGDLLIDVVLLLVLCAFTHRVTRAAPVPRKVLVALAGTVLVLFVFPACVNAVLTSLVRDSRIPLDLFHVQDLDVFSALTMLVIAMMLFSWLLLCDVVVRWVARRWSARQHLLLFVIACLTAYGMYHFTGEYDSVLALWPMLLFVIMLHAQRSRAQLAHALLLIAALSLYTVHVLNRQSFKRLEREREVLAESSATREDPVIEVLFREATREIRADVASGALIANDTSRVSATDLDTRLRRDFFTGPWENYDVRLTLFAPDGTLRGTTSPDGDRTLAALRARFEQGIPVSDDGALRNTHRPSENALYIGVIQGGAGNGDSQLFVELLPRVQPEGIGFPELLLAGDRANASSSRFVRARYEHGVLVESSGDPVLPGRWSRRLPSEGVHYEQSGVDLLATGDAKGTVVVLGSVIPSWTEHLTTFSYVFMLFALLAALGFLGFTLAKNGGVPPLNLTAQLRTGILVFAAVALVLFAFGSQRLLQKNYTHHTNELLDERMRSAVADLRQLLHLESSISPEQTRELDHWVDNTSTVLLTDLSFYSPLGELLATSREQVFNSGLLGTRMDPEAYRAMAVLGVSAFAHNERIGSARFRTAYRPFRNDRGQVLGFLAMPYFARQNEVEEERTAGYVAMVNLFVLLFLLSLIAAAVIANWTTRPLRSLKRGLERIRLGERNEPIPYAADDELGELVRVYNRKVDELRESAEKLARSERESAWREMAKQVAHEIKNPLTPMKLGIQHFQHTWTPDAPDGKARLEKFSNTLVEQIDALSRIANEFGHFAQMPPAHPAHLDLNEVAAAGVALFASEPNADLSITTAEPLRVHADREHLLRVFTNLIKNALQAIPGDRRGQVEVILHKAGDLAVAEVRDNGSGIPEEAQARLFTPSFTTKSSGMGLGLAMVKRMVEQAGGNVRFESIAGKGTSFFVSLPLEK